MSSEPEVQYLQHIITGLVAKPEAIRIDRSLDARGVLLTLYVDKEDMGSVIGRSGSIAKAIRLLTRAQGGRHDRTVSLFINEPDV